MANDKPDQGAKHAGWRSLPSKADGSDDGISPSILDLDGVDRGSGIPAGSFAPGSAASFGAFLENAAAPAGAASPAGMNAASTSSATTDAIAAGSAPLPVFGGTQTWNGGTDDWYDAANWTSATSGVASGYPLPGQSAVVASGEADLNGSEAKVGGTFDSNSVTLGSSGGATATLMLNSAVLGATFNVTTAGAASILASGTSVFQGTLFATSGTSLTLGSVNDGNLIFNQRAVTSNNNNDAYTFVGTTTVEETGASLLTAGAVTVSGTINLIGGRTSFNGAVTGSGTVNVGLGGTARFGYNSGAGSVASGLNVHFSDIDGVIELGSPTTFAGTISNFHAGDSIDFSKITGATGATYDATAHQLTLKNGSSTLATLNNVYGDAGSLSTSTSPDGGTRVSFAGATSAADQGAAASAVALGANTVQATLTAPGTGLKITGAGIKIGVISDSFNVQNGANAAAAAGFLPGMAVGTSPVTVLKEGSDVDSSGKPTDEDEGQAMCEAIYQDAPGAQLYFASATNTEAGFADSVQKLRDAGCQIIVDDFSYFPDANDQIIGPVATAAQSAVSAGVDYFTSGGNRGHSFVSMGFNPQTVTLPDGSMVGAAVFSNGTPYEAITVTSSSYAYLKWAAPFVSPDGSSAPNAMTFKVFDTSGNLKYTSTQDTAFDSSTIKDAASYAYLAAGHYYVAVYSNNGTPVPASFSFALLNNGSEQVINDPLAGNTVSGIGAAQKVVPGVNTVGAVYYGQTSAYGVQTVSNETFSSYGPGQLLYDANGNALATPQTLSNPSFSAPDGQYSTSLGNFYGTSAAAPNAAAVAALMLQADGRLTNTQVSYLLAQTATPFGYDTAQSGAGLIQAVPATQAAITAATTSIWTAQDGSTNWSDAANWSDDAVPGTNDTAQLTNGIGALTGSYNVTFDIASSTIGGLTLDGGTSASPTLTIVAGNTLTVSGTTTIAGNGTLAVVGAFSSAQIALTGTLALTSSNTGSVSGSISGSGTVVQSGTGTTTLSGNNTYSGATQITAGTLVAGSAGAFSANSNYAVAGTLDLGGLSEAVRGISGSGTVTNNGGGAATLTLTRDSNFSGTLADGSGQLGLTVAMNAFINLSGTAISTYSGATMIAGELKTFAANGLSAKSDYTLIQRGELSIGGSAAIGSLAGSGLVSLGNATLTIGATNASTLFSGHFMGTNNAIITKVGTGTLSLTNNNSYGATTIDAGTLDLGNARAASNGAISFEATSGQTANLALDQAAQKVGGTFGNALNDFADSDTLDLKSFANGVVLYDPNNSPTTLTVTSLTSGSEVFNLTGNHAGNYYAQSDGNGGTLITDQAPPVLTTTWIGPNGSDTNPGTGTYETAADWSNGTPTAASTAVLGSVAAGMAYMVMVDASETVATLQVGTNAALQSLAGGDLRVTGNLDNAGTVSAAGGTIEAATSDLSGGTLSGRWNVGGATSAITLTSSDNDAVTELASVLNLVTTGSSFSANGRQIETSLTKVDKGAVLRSLDGRDYTADQGDFGNGGLLAITDDGAIQLGGGTFTAQSLSGSGTFVGFGTLDATLNDITVSANGGILSVEGVGNIFNGRIAGTGTVNFDAGSDTFALGTVLLAAHTDLSGAAISLSANVSDRGAFEITAGSVDLGGKTFTAAGAASLGGGTFLDGGTVALRGATRLVDDTTVTGGTRLTNYGTLNAHADLTLGATGPTSSGNLTNAAGATYNIVGDGSIIAKAGSITNAGLIEKTGIGEGGISTLGGSGTAIRNSGTIEVTAGTLEVKDAVATTGKLDVEGSSTLKFDAAVASTQAMTFGADGGTLDLSNASIFRAKIGGFGGSDTIDLEGFGSSTYAVYHQAAMGGAGGTLSLVDGAHRANLAFSGTYATGNFSLTPVEGGEALHFKSSATA